jgi:hypothetical protein
MIIGSDGSFGPTPRIVTELVGAVAEHRTDGSAFDVVITAGRPPTAPRRPVPRSKPSLRRGRPGGWRAFIPEGIR